MGLFSGLFSKKQKAKIPEYRLAANLLRDWEAVHFPRSRNASENEDAARYSAYRTESGKTISLTNILLPKELYQKSLLDAVKGVFAALKGQALPAYILDYRKSISAEISMYEESRIKLGRLGETLREDPLFAEIDHVFCVKLRMLLGELTFCRFDDLRNDEYLLQMHHKLQSALEDIRGLNAAFSEYMYALTRTEYEDTGEDVERIRISVRSMSDVADSYAAKP